MKKPTILIVDDDNTTTSVINIYLEGFGYDVIGTATTGRIAIEKAKNLKPDIVLMDIKLGSGLDGIDAAEIISRHFGIQIIFVTAYANDVNIQRAKDINPVGFINKPIRDTDLKTTIELALAENITKNNRKNNIKSSSVKDILISIYDLSPAEARVTAKLLDYPDINSVSEQLNLSKETIKTHLKHIYRKTETNRLTVLIHKLINGPVGLILREKQTD